MLGVGWGGALIEIQRVKTVVLFLVGTSQRMKLLLFFSTVELQLKVDNLVDSNPC